MSEFLLYDRTLEQILVLLKAVEATDSETSNVYLASPIEVRTEEAVCGHLVCQDGIWGFRSLAKDG